MNPKLIIGLGGTGREVLLRIRRKLFEKNNTLDLASTHTSFLWIDTDPNDRDRKLTGDFQFSDYIDRKIRFMDNEVALATVEMSVVNQIKSAPDLHRNIWEWADVELFNKIMENESAITAGAKQTPPIGRFALFANAGKIRDALANRISVLGAGTLKVMIVGSLAGGTGAGMCLDVAAMLRCGVNGNVFPDLPQLDQVKIWGYFVLPDALCKDEKISSAAGFDQVRVKANGYAMLQELERASIDRTNKAAILSRGGRMKASWLFEAQPQSAPEVPLPVYNSILLFDGYGSPQQGAEPLKKIEDTYELLATLINESLADVSDAKSNQPNAWKAKFNSAEDNAEALLGSGHIETVPQGKLAAINSNDAIEQVMNDPDTKWADVQSYSFSVAGLSRITFETPRLRLLAAYRLAACAVDCWRGKLSSDFDAKLQGSNENLSHAVYRRLADALGIALNGEGDRTKDMNLPVAPENWRITQAIKAQFKEPALPPLESVKSYEALFKRFQEGGVYDSAGIVSLLIREWFDDPDTKLSNLGQRFVDDLRVTDDYLYQGGLEALSIAAGTASRQGGLRELLMQVRNVLERRENQHKKRMAATDVRKIQEACTAADITLRNFDTIKDSLMTLSATKEDAKRDALAKGSVAYDLIRDQRFDAMQVELFGGLKSAIDAVLRQRAQGETAIPKLAALEDDWRNSYTRGESFTTSLLNDPVFGLCRILDGLKKLNPDACTLHLGLPIQRDDAKLWDEMLKAFGGIDAIRTKITDLQHDFLAQINLGQSFFDMVAHERLDGINRETLVGDLVQRAGGTEAIKERLLRGETISGFLRDARLNERLVKIQELMGNKNASPQNPITWLKASCHPRAELPARIFRQSFVGGSVDGFQQPKQRHSYIVSQEKLADDQVAGFQVLPGSDPHQILAVVMEVGVPLSNFAVLNRNASLQYSQPASQLHFLPPKTAYPPIHRMSEEEGDERLDCAVQALMSVILGQFRPARTGGGKCFALNCSRIVQGDHPYAHINSLGALIYHLGDKGTLEKLPNHLLVSPDPNVKKRQALKERNDDILGKLNVYTLAALLAICDYNMKWCNKQTAKFRKYKAKANAEDEAMSVDVGPQALVLARVKKSIETFINKPGGMNVRDNNFIMNVREPLADYLHHVAEFVPVILDGKAEGGQFLVLRTRCERINDVKAEEDLIDRSQHNPIRDDLVSGFLALKTPRAFYTAADGAATLKIHKILSGTDEHKVVSMNPYVANTTPKLMEGLSEATFIDVRVMRGDHDHITAFDWDKLVPKPCGYWLDEKEHPDYSSMLHVDDMRDLIQGRVIDKNTRVCRDTDVANDKGDWHPLSDIPELKRLLPSEVGDRVRPEGPKTRIPPGARQPVMAPKPPPRAAPLPPLPPRRAAQTGVEAASFAIDPSGKMYSAAELAKLAASGSLSSDDSVWNTDLVNWTPISDVPELSGLFERKPVNRPMPPPKPPARYPSGIDAVGSMPKSPGNPRPIQPEDSSDEV